MNHLGVLIVAILLLPCQAHAEKRVALVIGNDSYTEVTSLQKARNDARAMAVTLETASGFEVTVALDTNRRQMNREISRFVDRLEPGDTALLFFAGHGVEIDGQNYLLPTDIPAASSADLVTSEAIELPHLLERIRGSGARLTLAIIDACRDNPFATAGKRSLGGRRGLALMSAPEGTFVVFSAGAGQAALDSLGEDDPHPNSVFTRSLLPMISEPGRGIRDLAVDLRRNVHKTAGTINHIQTPAYYDELLGDFSFVQSTAAPAGDPVISDRIQADFKQAESIGTEDAWAMFLNEYNTRESDFLVKLAHTRLAALSERTGVRGETGVLERPDLAKVAPAIDECDRLAAHPADGQRPEGVNGVNWKTLAGGKAKTVCSAASIADPNNARIMFQLGRAYHKSGQAAVAAAYFSRAANTGYAAAVTSLGFMYQNGFGVKKDPGRAVDLYRVAANRGDARGQAHLGTMYRRGLGVEKDYARAVRLYSKSARQGFSGGQVNLGGMYHRGHGVPKDLGRAVDLYRLSAGQNNPRGQASLGFMYQRGLGVEKDIQRAIRLYRKAADQGDARAMNDLAIALSKRPAHTASPTEIARLLIASAKKGNNQARANLQQANRRLPIGVRKEIQRILRNAGLYTGVIDGVLGEKSKAALQQFTKG